MAAAAKPNHDHLFARFAQTPALVDPSRQDEFEACLRAVAAHERGPAMLGETMAAAANGDDYWPKEGDWRAMFRPYVVDANGILKVPVQGVLLNKFGYQFGFATGYQYIQKAIERGLADSMVKGIALIIDSPGGEVAGNFELVDKIFGWRGTKPIRAFAYDYAYSAAYSIASAADAIAMTRTGGVGSIGVVTMHVDYSAALEKMGVRITFIFAGKHKVDGNAYEKLPDSVKARIQKRIDKTYGIFTATVARNRDLDEKDVRATEAATFGAEEAIENGLADSVAVFEDAYAAFAEELRDTDGDPTMGKENETETVTKAVHDAAVATARKDGETAGVKAERSRITTILGSDAGKARPNAALAAALETDMTSDQATAFLAKLPEEKSAEKKDDAAAGKGAGVGDKLFEAAMGNTPNPEVGADGKPGESAEQTDEQRIFGSFQAATGYKSKQK